MKKSTSVSKRVAVATWIQAFIINTREIIAVTGVKSNPFAIMGQVV
jgi:hypothetical protein